MLSLERTKSVHFTCNVQRATCNVQRATCNVQRATCNVQRILLTLAPEINQKIQLTHKKIF